MTDPTNSVPVQAGAGHETRNTFNGVLVSGHIHEIIGDLVGGDKITNNFGNPAFEAKLLDFFGSRDASNSERLALATNLIALRLSTVFVDQMRLLYITTGRRVKQANAHLRAHFVERAESDTKQFNTYMERYSGAQLDKTFLKDVYAVEQRCARTLTQFTSVHPLPRDQRRLFREMANAAGPMRQILQAADANAIASTVAVVNDIGAIWLQSYFHPVGFAKADEIAMLRFEIQAEALRRLQSDTPTQILTIDDDVEGRFSPLYFIIDEWLLDRCKPWT
jgi:hypothetical protein